MKRVAFEDRLWRPEPFRGSETREERSRLADFLATRSEPRRQSLDAIVMQHPELSHKYMAEVRRKIKGEPEPEAAEFPRRVGRLAGDR